MKKFLLAVIFLFSLLLTAQQRSILKGQILNTKQEVLKSTTLIIPALKKGTSSDENGMFTFTNIPYGKHTIQISSIGYKTIEEKITVSKPTTFVTIILPEKVEELEEVVITYDKVKTIKRKKTVAVEVVNEQFIAENLGGSLMQSLDKLAGVTTVGIGSGQSKPVIRGLSFNRVLVAEKGLKHEAQQWGADHGLEVDQYDAKNIEVLKGPSSLLYGSDAIGGVINLKRNDFPKKNSINGEINSSYMSNNNSFSGSLQVEKRTNKFLIGGRVTHIKYDDYKAPTDSVSIYELEVALHKNRLRNTAGREYNYHLHTGYIADKFHSVFYGSSYNAKSGFFANAHGLEPAKVDEAFYDEFSGDIANPMQKVNHYKITNETKLEAGNHQLKMITGFQRNIREERGRYIPHGHMLEEVPKELNIPTDLERKFTKDFYAIKFIDVFHIKENKITVGIDANYQKNEIGGWGFIIPSFKQYNIGVFAIDEYKINNDLRLQGGLRYDYGNIEVEKYVDWFPTEKEDGTEEYLVRASNFNKEFHNVSFSTGLVYNKEKFTFKGNIGNSFRMPIAKELAANGVNYHYFRYEKGNANLKPERSYQLDLNAEWNEQKWAIQISPFINYFPNYIYLNPTPSFDYSYGAGNQIFNYTQSEVFRYGGELHAHADLSKHLQVGTIVEYVKAKQLSGAKEGFGLPFAPPFNVLFNAKYSMSSYGVFLDPYFNLDFKITDNQKDIVPPEKETDGYQLINLGMGTKMEFNHYIAHINFQVKNLLDEKYFNHTSFYRLINLPEQGRNFVVTLKLSL